MSSVFCLGVAVLDLVFAVPDMPTAARKYRATDFTRVGGGCAATAAVAIARLGGTAMLGARLGDDATGADIVADLEAWGVDCAHVQRFAGHRSSLSSVFVDAAGERMIVNYRDPDLPQTRDWLPDPARLGVGAVLADNRWAPGAAEMLARARAAGLPGVLDAETPLDAGSEAAIEAASHVAFSAPGLRDFAGDGRLPSLVQRVAARHGGFVCVTDGADGTHASRAGAPATHHPAPRVAAVDTLGAGDVWHGAFALRLAEGADEATAIRFANATAALKCTRFGGRAGVPTRADVDTLLAEEIP